MKPGDDEIVRVGRDGMEITGLEAHFLLFALDDYLGVDANGKLLSAKHGYSRSDLQNLRDRLFAAHEHPPEDDEQFAGRPAPPPKL